MMQVFSGRPRGAFLLCAVFCTAVAASAGGASISGRTASFQGCLEGRFEKWVDGRAELVVNEDPKAGDIDDVAVAAWTAETLSHCRAQAGGGDPALEHRFTKRVAQWRQHIDGRVQNIRELVRPD